MKFRNLGIALGIGGRRGRKWWPSLDHALYIYGNRRSSPLPWRGPRFRGYRPADIQYRSGGRRFGCAKLQVPAGHRFPVGLTGQSCDMRGLMALAEEHRVPVVDDAAHALPATFEGNMIGRIATATVFSFYATKTVATTRSDAFNARCSPAAKGKKDALARHRSRRVFALYLERAPVVPRSSGPRVQVQPCLIRLRLSVFINSEKPSACAFDASTSLLCMTVPLRDYHCDVRTGRAT